MMSKGYSKMLISLLSIITMTVAYPQSTFNPADFVDIFGLPPSATSSPNQPTKSPVTTSPTKTPTILTNENGEKCQCVPYYICDDKKNAVDITNSSVNGYGMLDVRFGVKHKCDVTTDNCCTNTRSEPQPTIPDPPRLTGCGFRNPKGLDFTVIGDDNESQFGEFPWVVALLDAENSSYIGVGTLIHPQVVITGAHIALTYLQSSPSKLVVRAGEWDTQTNNERLKSQERLVQDIAIREDFHPKSVRNDIALLRLQKPFDLAEHINIMCLPNQNEDFDSYKQCVSNGWGKDKFGQKGNYAVILKRIEIDMVPFQRCGALLKKTRLGERFKLHESFVCAGGEEGKDTCKGDGGGPLACPIGNNRYKLTGLVAWGVGCGEKNVPAVYARVSMFRKWVDDIMLSWGYPSDGYTVY